MPSIPNSLSSESPVGDGTRGAQRRNGSTTKQGQKEGGPFMPEREEGEESGAKLGLSQSYYLECKAK